MTTPANELVYWENAAQDPDVLNKYIANIDLQACVAAIDPHLKSGSVLEIGCGIGRLTTVVAELHPESQLHGIDISPAMLSLAPKSTVKYRVNDGRTIPYPSQSFDSIYSMLVFQHIPDEAKLAYINEAARTLKDGGVFRVQFVEGTHHSPIDHNTTYEKMYHWLDDAGLKVTESNPHLIFPEWNWITATKQGAK